MTRPSDGLVVRPARPGDLVRVVQLEVQCFADPWTPASMLGELTADRMRLPLVAEQAGIVRGYLLAWRVSEQLHILNLATDPECQRQGLATALLRAAAGQALDEGLLECTLEVRRSNLGARAFYTRHGFREVGVRPRYYADNGEDALVMDCDLAPLAGRAGPPDSAPEQ